MLKDLAFDKLLVVYKGKSRRVKDRERNERESGAAAILLLFFIGWGIWYLFFKEKPSELPATYKSQMEALSNAQNTLNQLNKFLDDQKKTLIEREQLLADLQNETETLKKFINTNRPIVEAILEQHQKKYQRDRWIEWLIAFVIGVASTLFCSLLIHIVRSFKTKEPVKKDE